MTDFKAIHPVSDTEALVSEIRNLRDRLNVLELDRYDMYKEIMLINKWGSSHTDDINRIDDKLYGEFAELPLKIAIVEASLRILQKSNRNFMLIVGMFSLVELALRIWVW